MKLLVILEDNFNDLELVTPITIWSRSNKFEKIDYFNPVLKSANGQLNLAKIDNILNEVDFKDYDAIFIPGGKGAQVLRKNFKSHELINKFVKNQKLVWAICDAPNALKENDLIPENTKFTSFPSEWSKLFRYNKDYEDTDVVVSNNFITGSSAMTAEKLAYKVLEEIFDKQTAIDTYKSIIGK
ncbi:MULTISPECIES: DJ-1/PfpI family protein [unclassified Mycoplasma]|uniref:DJ-1/PfpI family protein n=1 Tax=unclassified Mycoplasma TaxID=2683645 RepID=UPI00197C36A9|nr:MULTISPECIES: DJ-1/PfpI family protein [unclassified Mycoplasma]MBN4084109.1 DJ-1/PfpI family protein [Mycoplasma sp. CSL10166]MBU4693193.1 DJ-1/PfpI family protein [Mycoplasma sp. CSL7491-lung]